MTMCISYSVYRLIHKNFINSKTCRHLCFVNFNVSCSISFSKQTESKSRKKVIKNKESIYSGTVNLPQTKFPLTQKHAHQRELKLQASEDFQGLYAWQSQQTSRPKFVLHDGPPYANGRAHIGHAVNKILKDVTNRYKLLTGHCVHYRPGWDCHGLPIEHKVLASNIDLLDSLTPLQIRHKARDFAIKTIECQEEAFKRWGVMADWRKPYLTMDKQYEARQLEVFADMYLKGLVYRDYMPVYWSPSSRTALAEAELEYNENHVSRAVYVRFPLTTVPSYLRSKIGDRRVYALIWTTTPWTLPANRAIAYAADLEYMICDCDGDLYITGSPFSEKLGALLGKTVKTIATIQGEDLAGCTYRNKLLNLDGLPLVAADHVTPEKGTGLVHTAPAHGHDDFKVASRYKLPVDCIVDEDGCFSHDIDSPLARVQVLGQANDIVSGELGDDLVHAEDFTHSYPYDWRTKQPVIVRASQQWFIDTKRLLHKAKECMGDVVVHPNNVDWRQLLIQKLESRPYWCISRQRSWGVAIPVFYRHNVPLINKSTLDHVISLVRQHGSDCWWTLPSTQLLPHDIATTSIADDVTKGTDILDIWFDSGVSWANALPPGCNRADMYLEGIDQLGGWFQTSLLTAVAANGVAPYKQLVIHGFAVDEEGKKMSKSVGNVVDPIRITDGGGNERAYGADTLRWWVAVSGLESNIYVGPKVIEQCDNTIYTLRKTLRYLLGNLSDFVDTRDSMEYADLLPLDQYMLHLLHELTTEVTGHYENINYAWAALTIERFMNAQLSNFYCNVIKDRLYCDAVESVGRRSCQTVLHHTLDIITKCMAPILPHLAEEVYSYSTHKADRKTMLFHDTWTTADPLWHNRPLNDLFKQVTRIRDTIYTTLASRPSIHHHAVIQCGPTLYTHLKSLQAEDTDSSSPVTDVLQTAYTTITDAPYDTVDTDIIVDTSPVHDIDCVGVAIRLSDSLACERCRRHTASKDSPLCHRCYSMLESQDNLAHTDRML